MRQQAAVLEDVADATPMRRQVDAGGRIEEHASAHGDAAFGRAGEPRDEPEHRRLAGAGAPEERGDARTGAERGFEREASRAVKIGRASCRKGCRSRWGEER